MTKKYSSFPGRSQSLRSLDAYVRRNGYDLVERAQLIGFPEPLPSGKIHRILIEERPKLVRLEAAVEEGDMLLAYLISSVNKRESVIEVFKREEGTTQDIVSSKPAMSHN